jgi:hypothetical protein
MKTYRKYVVLVSLLPLFLLFQNFSLPVVESMIGAGTCSPQKINYGEYADCVFPLNSAAHLPQGGVLATTWYGSNPVQCHLVRENRQLYCPNILAAPVNGKGDGRPMLGLQGIFVKIPSSQNRWDQRAQINIGTGVSTLPGLELWLSTRYLRQQEGESLDTWKSLDGSREFIQPEAARQPKIKTYRNFRALSFDGVDDFMQLKGKLPNSGDFTISAVLIPKKKDSETKNFIFSGHEKFVSISNDLFSAQVGFQEKYTGVTSDERENYIGLRALTVLKVGRNLNLFINGVLKKSTALPATTSSGTALNYLLSSANLERSFYGDLVEFASFNRALSTDERGRAECLLVKPYRKLAGVMGCRALVGAIRWDGWANDEVGETNEMALNDGPWLNRVPFFAQYKNGAAEITNYSVSADTMGKEIDYAASAGIDYWAFLFYTNDTNSKETGLYSALEAYLNHPKRNNVPFALISEPIRWRNPKHFSKMLHTMISSDSYLKVKGGRPLLYVMLSKEDALANYYADYDHSCTSPSESERVVCALKNKVQAIRDYFRAAGKPSPFIVAAHGGALDAADMASKLGLDGLSSYVQTGVTGSYFNMADKIMTKKWPAFQAAAAGNFTFIPTATSGWDPSPRKNLNLAKCPGPADVCNDYINHWHHYDEFVSTGAPYDIAYFMKSAALWSEDHNSDNQVKATLTYAWNEYAEGGWLTPTYGLGTARVDALRDLFIPNPIATRLEKLSQTIPQAPGYEIIVVAGQSNAVGKGKGPWAEPPELVAMEETTSQCQKICQLGRRGARNNQIVPAVDPLDHWNPHPGEKGFALSFAKRLALQLPANRKILIVPVAKGGSSILYWDKILSPFPNTAKEADSTLLFDDMSARIDRALAIPGKNRIVAFLWQQGETDIGIAARNNHPLNYFMRDSQVYYGKLTGLHRNVRARFPQWTCYPFLMGEPVPTWGPAIKSSFIDAIHDVAAHEPCSDFVSSEGLESNQDAAINDDEFHLSAQSQLDLAERYFEIFLQKYW